MFIKIYYFTSLYILCLIGLDNVRKASMFPRDPNRCTP